MRHNPYRFIYMIVAGILIYFLMHAIVYTNEYQQHPMWDVMVTILITVVIWEGNLRIDAWMNLHYPWVKNIRSRLLFHLPSALVYTASSLYLILFIYSQYICGLDTEHKKLMTSSIVIGLLISTILLTFEVSSQFLRGWKQSLTEVERYKTESVQAQLQNLKNQINPHFLFNNLSVLTSLVYKDQDKAADFIKQLSQVYRYLLDNRDHELVRLEEELTFLQSYIYLLKIRFADNIHFNVEIKPENLNALIPPMCLQMLVENAIQHNEISAEHPLRIDIQSSSQHISVRNNLQLRTNPEVSSKTGLSNIRDRYTFFTDQRVEIISNEASFIVQLPLISST
ncbi:MAG: histidine kinase [Chitinophagaceae bacterium]|nr:histidine kinase [Chitinophagaceae bacterium]